MSCFLILGFEASAGAVCKSPLTSNNVTKSQRRHEGKNQLLLTEKQVLDKVAEEKWKDSKIMHTSLLQIAFKRKNRKKGNFKSYQKLF